MSLFRVFALSFVITVLAEGALAYLLGLRRRRDQELVFLVNLLTNPAVVYLSLLSAWFLEPGSRRVLLALLEAAAIGVEAFIYTKKLDWENLPAPASSLGRGGKHPAAGALVLSLILNGFSYGMGEVVEMLMAKSV